MSGRTPFTTLLAKLADEYEFLQAENQRLRQVLDVQDPATSSFGVSSEDGSVAYANKRVSPLACRSSISRSRPLLGNGSDPGTVHEVGEEPLGGGLRLLDKKVSVQFRRDTQDAGALVLASVDQQGSRMTREVEGKWSAHRDPAATGRLPDWYYLEVQDAKQMEDRQKQWAMQVFEPTFPHAGSKLGSCCHCPLRRSRLRGRPSAGHLGRALGLELGL